MQGENHSTAAQNFDKKGSFLAGSLYSCAVSAIEFYLLQKPLRKWELPAILLEVSAFVITENIYKMAFEQVLKVQKPEYK